jgi:integrase
MYIYTFRVQATHRRHEFVLTFSGGFSLIYPQLLKTLQHPRRRKVKETDPPDFGYIYHRRQQLLHDRFDSKYGQAKLAQGEAISKFLATVPRNPPPTLMTCKPFDVLCYFIHISQFGRTVVHGPHCVRVEGCDCPLMKKASTLSGQIGSLRKLFHFLGRSDDNPCAHEEVTEYLVDIQREQKRAGVCTNPAVPLFTDKVIKILSAIDETLAYAPLTDVQRFILLRDAAIFAVDSASGQRAQDLLSLRVGGIVSFPDQNGYLLGFLWGKTLRSGDRHHFGIRARLDFPVLCPCARLREYLEFGLSIGVPFDEDRAYVFVPYRYGDIDVTVELNADTIRASLRSWLEFLDIYEKETFHGVRAAFAIEQAITGQPLHRTLAICHWSSEVMRDQYTRLHEILEMATAAPVSSELYRELDQMQRCLRAFPPRSAE